MWSQSVCENTCVCVCGAEGLFPRSHSTLLNRCTQCSDSCTYSLAYSCKLSTLEDLNVFTNVPTYELSNVCVRALLSQRAFALHLILCTVGTLSNYIFHYMPEVNIALFSPLHLSDSFNYKLLFRLRFFITIKCSTMT